MIYEYHIVIGNNDTILYMENKTIYFCNKTKHIPPQVLQKWSDLNPLYTVQLYDDAMCEDFLLKYYGPLHQELFQWLQDGPIKADFWRICILNTYGGVYADIDIDPFEPIDSFLEKDVDFLTGSSFWEKKGFLFNPNIIISKKDSPILQRCIQWYIKKYTEKCKYEYWEWSIMQAFTDCLQLPKIVRTGGIYYLEGAKIQIIKECEGETHYDSHMQYKNRRLFNNRSRNWDHKTHKFH